MTITASNVSRVELAEKLRSRAMRHPYRSVDRDLMVQASDGLLGRPDEDDGSFALSSLDAEVIFRWLLDHDVRLLPWQRNRLGLEIELGTGT